MRALPAKEMHNMPTIIVRGISQETYDELRRLAEADGQSLNAEARAIFEEAIRQRRVRRSREEALRLADESRAQARKAGNQQPGIAARRA